MLQEKHINPKIILGVGIGTVGPLDREKGILFNPPNFPAPGWVNVPLKDILEKEIDLPITVDNGANTAVLVENIFGAGKGFSNMAYFHCGIGIRTGAIAGGKIVRTINDAEDAFGHMIIDVDGEQCNCGNFDCVDCYSSIPAIVTKFITALKKGRVSNTTTPLDQMQYSDICAAAEEDDDLAKEIIVEAATILGSGLANYINLLNSGWSSSAGR